MRVCSPIITCLKSVVLLGECAQKQMSSSLCVVSQSPSNACCLYVCSSNKKKGYIGMHTSKRISGSSITNFQAFRGYCFQPGSFKQKGNLHTFSVNSSTSSQAVNNSKVDISLLCQNMNVRVLLPKQGILSKIKLSVGRMSWPRRCASAGILFGLLVAYSSSKPALTEAARSNEGQNGRCTSSVSSFSHGKKVFTDYSVTGIPGDGRCQFRSVVHGACLRSGNPAPTESFQRELADELRARVADEFVKRRKETEWFIEGDFDAYVSQIRKPHVWGGEPELLMASHVLRMPITVYMHDDDSGGLISIAEYGEEYGKENPIMVLYHGFGHYDALQIPGKGPNSRL